MNKVVRLTPDLLRQSLRLAAVMFGTAAIALWSDRTAYLWYSLYAALIVVDDNDELTIPAAKGRIFGTILGALITFLVHTIVSGWVAVLIACLFCLPLLRLMGWQGGLSTAMTIIVMFLMIPGQADFSWNFVFNRSLDVIIGIVVAVTVSFLFWPRNRLVELERLDLALDHQIRLIGGFHLMSPIQQATSAHLINAEGSLLKSAEIDLTEGLLRLARLVELAMRSQQAAIVRRKRWWQRLLLWETLLHHFLELERHQALFISGKRSPLLTAAIDDERQRVQQALHSMTLCRNACR
ncbi:aromatic acid exporter family protein [Cyanobium sp. WAJ14-Wanaka]|uniref:FUSC family protein n=1 Tax=Cyanobium sp. WAJ14-Wanaka TaxID=2823725 RepID=UPI0020CCBC8D|nr:FUSC family protein [Cyanobium sp. WAJ14-Wanaka]MCP9775091.1 FUSC family protein [Cyanobium sp. WAJ14-Wanaka]